MSDVVDRVVFVGIEQRKLEVRRLLLEAFVRPENAHVSPPPYETVANDPDAEVRRVTIVSYGNVPSPIGLADASIAIGAAVDAIAVQRGASRDDVLKMLAVVALRIAARDA